MYSLQEINNMNREQFIENVGWVFEHSPWVANQAWNYKPFIDLEMLHQIMVQVVREASISDQLDLIRAHPDLGSKFEMTESSVREQKGAGLDSLTEKEYEEFATINQAYVKKFNFPFILAVKGHTKDFIYKAMMERYLHSEEEEFQTALKQIYAISKFRLEDTIINEKREGA